MANHELDVILENAINYAKLEALQGLNVKILSKISSYSLEEIEQLKLDFKVKDFSIAKIDSDK